MMGESPELQERILEFVRKRHSSSPRDSNWAIVGEVADAIGASPSVVFNEAYALASKGCIRLTPSPDGNERGAVLQFIKPLLVQSERAPASREAPTGTRIRDLFRGQFGPELRLRIETFKAAAQQKRAHLLKLRCIVRSDELADALIPLARAELQERAKRARLVLQGTIRDTQASLKSQEVLDIFDAVVEIPIAQDIESTCHGFFGPQTEMQHAWDKLEASVARDKRTAVDLERGILDRW